MRRATLIAALAALFAAPVAAADWGGSGGHTTSSHGQSPTFDKVSSNKWKDTACGTSAQKFKIRLWRGTGYSGKSVVICSFDSAKWLDGADGGNTMCEVPLDAAVPPPFGPAECISGETGCDTPIGPLYWTIGCANDRFSSLKVTQLASHLCLRLHTHKHWGNGFLEVHQGDQIPDLGSWSIDDKISSIRRRSSNSGQCSAFSPIRVYP